MIVARMHILRAYRLLESYNDRLVPWLALALRLVSIPSRLSTAWRQGSAHLIYLYQI